MVLSWLTSHKSIRNSRNSTQRLELEWLESRAVPSGTRLPEFSLPDQHPSTPTSGQNIGPATFRGDVSGYYFANPG